MAKSSFADINIPLMAIGEHKAAVRKFNEDPRRRRIQTHAPDGEATSSPWRVKQLSEADKLPRWVVSRPKDGPAQFTEQKPDPNVVIFDAPNRPKNDSVFKLRISRACGLGLNAEAAVGDLVQCFGATACELINNGQAEVIEEIRPA